MIDRRRHAAGMVVVTGAGRRPPEPVLVVGAADDVLPQAVADLAVELGPPRRPQGRAADRVDEPDHAGLGLRAVQVEVDGLHDLGALVHPVAPVGLAAVAGGDPEVHGEQLLDLHGERAARRLREGDRRRVDHAGARHEVEVVLGPAQLLVLAAGPPGGERPGQRAVLEDAGAVAVLLHDVEDREVVEAHRRVVPEERADLAGVDAGVLGLADRPHAPGAVAGAPPRVGRDGEVLAGDRHRPLPLAELGEALGVEGDAAVAAHEVRVLEERRVRAGPGDVDGDAVRLLDHEAQSPQGFHDLDADRADRRVEAVAAELAGRADDPVEVGAVGRQPADAEEGVLHVEVRVLAQPEDAEQVVGPPVHVEVVAVVEVAVAGADVADHLGDLVDGVVVEGRQGRRHGVPPGSGVTRPPGRGMPRRSQVMCTTALSSPASVSGGAIP